MPSITVKNKEGEKLMTSKRLPFGRFKDIDMTQGGIAGNIIKFAIPLLAGNLFQQLYNMVDTWVIGQTGENGAYAAVGSVGPIINILVGFFLGLSSGAGVVISQYFGAKDDEKVHDAVHTSMMMTLIFAALFTVVGILMTPFMLDIMLHSESEASDTVYYYGKEYLTIYFAGVSGLMVYNMGSGILRAVGDSARPFYFLVLSALMNIVLDLLFVFGLDMGVKGVAIATIISQFVSAVLVTIVLLRSKTTVKLTPTDLKIDFKMLGKIVKVGIPAALQMALTAFSNVFVQSYIAGVNGDKTFCLGGWTTYSKIDQFIFLPVQSLSLSATTFVGQNLGSGNVKRAKKGTYISYFMATACTVVLMAVIMIFAPFLASLFNKDENVVHYATVLLHYITPFYVFCCINQVFSASMRGAGNSRAPMIIMLCSFVAFRQVYLYVMSNYISNDIIPIALGYPAGWFVCAVSTLLYYRFFFDFEKNKLV